MGSPDRRTAFEVLNAQRPQRRRYAGRTGDERQFRPEQEPRDAQRHLHRRRRVHDHGEAHTRPMGPRRASDLDQYVATTRTLRRQADHVVLRHARVAKAPPDDIRMRIRQETLHEVAIRAPSKRLTLAESKLAPSPEVGDTIATRVGTGRGNRVDRVPDEASQREERLAGSLLSKPLEKIGHSFPVQRVDDGNQSLTRGGFGLLCPLADRIEDAGRDL